MAYSGGPITTESIQKYLDENKQLILAILDNQNLGKLNECASYQAKLQQNLMYLAAIADAQPQAPQSSAQGPGAAAVQQSQYLQHQQQQQQQQHMAQHPAMLQQGQRNPAQYIQQQQSHAAHQQQQAMHGGQQGMVPGGSNAMPHMMSTDPSLGGNGTTSSAGGFPDYGHGVKAGPGSRDSLQSGMGMQHVEMRSGGGPSSEHMGVAGSMGQGHARDDSEPSYLKASDEDGST